MSQQRILRFLFLVEEEVAVAVLDLGVVGSGRMELQRKLQK